MDRRVGTALHNALGLLPEVRVYDGFMDTVNKGHIGILLAGHHTPTTDHLLDRGAIAPADLADIGGVGDNIPDGAGGPLAAAGGGYAKHIQLFGDREGAEGGGGAVGR